MQLISQIRVGDSAVLTFDPITDATGKQWNSTVYALNYFINGNGRSAPVSIAGVVNGTGWKVTISTTALSGATPPVTPSLTTPYTWAAVLTAAGERWTAWKGDLLVLPDASASDATFDPRSQEEKDLAAIQAAISARIANATPLKYTIGTRSLENEPIKALMDLEARYKLIVRNQKAAQSVANGLGNPNRAMVTFR